MGSIYDMYIRDNIMAHCNKYFEEYLIEEGAEFEGLTGLEKELIYIQIDKLIDMISRTYKEHEVEEEALAAIIDKLIGFCIVGKMNETRLCRLLNIANKED